MDKIAPVTEVFNPLELLQQFREQNIRFTRTFFEEYSSWIELLNNQVFLPQGYELVCVKTKN